MKGERWSTEEEIEQVLVSLEKGEQGGVVLLRKNQTNFVFCDEGHTTIVGGSGTGKSRRVTFGQLRALILKHESFIVIDPKGELYKNTACYAKDSHNIKVFNCRQPGYSQRWNPLRYAWELWHRNEHSAAQEKVREFVKDFTGDYTTNDNYWKESLDNLTTGMAYLLIQFPDKNHCNIGTIYSLLSEDRDSLRGTVSNEAGIVWGGALRKTVDALKDDDPAKQLLAGYLSAALATRSSVLTTVTNKLADFCISEEICNLTSGDDFDLINLNVDDKPLAVYVITPDGNKIYSEIAAMLVSQLTTHFKNLADNKYDGVLPNRLNIILEELGNVGRSISALPELMSASRSRNIRMTFVVQSLSQLDSLYGRHNAETIRGNTNVWLMFRNSNWETLQTFSRQCGDRRIKAGDIVGVQPLINPTQLGAMEIGQALVMINGRTKYITKFPDYTEMFDCTDLVEVPLEKTLVDKSSKPRKLADLSNLITGATFASKRQKSPYKEMLYGRL
jgi:type IV secretion system protein VirD4